MTSEVTVTYLVLVNSTNELNYNYHELVTKMLRNESGIKRKSMTKKWFDKIVSLCQFKNEILLKIVFNVLVLKRDFY